MIVALIGDNQLYVTGNFPPLFCGPSDEHLIFYSIMFILNICLMVGIPVLIVLFWIVHKVCFVKEIHVLHSMRYECITQILYNW